MTKGVMGKVRERIEPGSREDFPSYELEQLRTDRRPFAIFSYSRPADIFWAEFCRRLVERGWTKGEVLALVQSKFPRHAMDGFWTSALEGVACFLADRMVRLDLSNYTSDESVAEATKAVEELEAGKEGA